MAYKDKEKQKAANRAAKERWKARQGIPLKGIPVEGIPQGIPEDMTMTPEGPKAQVPANYGQPDCQCYHCQQNRRSDHKLLLNHGAYKPIDELAPGEANRVSLPGDIDFTPTSQPAYSQTNADRQPIYEP